MSESLRQRVGRLVAGGFNALVDAVENAAPETVMEQAIREIDTAVSEVRKELGIVEAQRHLTAKRLADDGKRHDELSEQAQLALEQEREDLAEAAVSRQDLIWKLQIPVLESRLADLADEKGRLEGYIGALKAKKREMGDDPWKAIAKAQRQHSGGSDSASSGSSGGQHSGTGLIEPQRPLSAFSSAKPAWPAAVPGDPVTMPDWPSSRNSPARTGSRSAWQSLNPIRP